MIACSANQKPITCLSACQKQNKDYLNKLNEKDLEFDCIKYCNNYAYDMDGFADGK